MKIRSADFNDYEWGYCDFAFEDEWVFKYHDVDHELEIDSVVAEQYRRARDLVKSYEDKWIGQLELLERDRKWAKIPDKLEGSFNDPK